MSVVLPSFDEIANLRKGVLEKVSYFLEHKPYAYEVVVVDDGSTDGSVEFMEKFVKGNKHFALIKNPHFGKAGAVTTGMLKAKGEFVLFTDMDQATPIEEIDKLLPYIQGLGKDEKKYDIVIGSRQSARVGAPLSRKVMAKGMIILRSMLVGLSNISDTQCGFKLFRRDVAQRVFVRINSIHRNFQKVSGSNVTAGFDVELLYIAEKLGYRIKEVPVEWLYVETRRVNPIKDSLEGLRELIRIRLNAMAKKY